MLLGQLEPFFINLTMKYTPKIRGRHVRLMILEQELTQWWCLGAFRKALDLLHWAMRVVWYRRIAMAIKMASKVGVFFIVGLSIVALAAAKAIRSA